MRLSIAFALLAALPAASFAQKKELLDLQRDVNYLREDFAAYQKTQNERFRTIETSLKAVLDQLAATNRSVTVLDASLKDRVEKSVVGPISAVGTKVDGLGEDFRSVRETVNELNAKMAKLQQQIADLNNVIRTMQAPPAPPQPVTPAGPPPGVSAKSQYDSAFRDMQAGNSDLALKEFTDYLAWFGDTEIAPNAQFYIGQILYNQKQYEEALKAFDKVLEGYPKNAKSLDAQFMKGRTLVKLGRRNDGADEFREIIRTAPGSDLAARSRIELKDLGLSTPSSATATKKKK